jgi:outer membrane protein assembly factor BamB
MLMGLYMKFAIPKHATTYMPARGKPLAQKDLIRLNARYNTVLVHMRKFGVVVGVICAVFLSSLLFVCVAYADSPMFSSDSSDSGEGNTVLIPTELWNFTAAKNATANTIRISWTRPVAVDGVVYIGELKVYTIPGESYEDPFGFGPPQHTLGTIYALKASSGAKIWNFTDHSSVGSPVVIDGVAYFGAGGNIYALDAVSGAQIWVHNTGGGTPIVIDGVVYISAVEPYHFYVSALSAANGDELWKYKTGNNSPSPLAIVDGVIYFGAGEEFYALNATNGDKLWSYITGGNDLSSSTIVDGVIYFSSNNNLYALNAENGDKLWSYSTGSNNTGSVLSSPTVVGGIVYVNGVDLNVYALDTSNGNKLWNYTTSGMFLSPLTVIDDAVYFSSGDTFYALNAVNGAQLWSYNTSGTGSSTISDGVVYYNSGNTLRALNAVNGNSLWSYTTSSNQSSFLTVVNGVAYFGEGNTVYALSIPATLSPSPTPTPPTPTSFTSGGNQEFNYQLLIITSVIVVIVVLSAVIIVRKRKTRMQHN